MAKGYQKPTRLVGVKVAKVMPGTYLEKRTPEQQREIFRKAMAEQNSEGRSRKPAGPNAPAIHDDRLYRTKYDPGLGLGYSSRTERRELVKAINRRNEARGDPRLIEAG